ncbi:MAG: hypothetical protein K6G73_05765 [Marinilabiliaceae bacterium]|nr:hypothetical protein [Marinilabiliaceae bacterium]
MAIFKIEDNETIDLLKTPEVCDRHGHLVSLPRLTPTLKNIATQYMEILFSYGNYATIPNPIVSPHEISIDAFLHLFSSWFSKCYEKESHSHISAFFRSLGDDNIKLFLTGTPYRHLVALDNTNPAIRRLIAFKPTKGNPKFSMDNYGALLNDYRDIVLHFCGATLFLPVGKDGFADRKVKIEAIFSRRRKELCLYPKGFDEFNKPYISDDNYSIRWSIKGKQISLQPQWQALYVLYYMRNEGKIEPSEGEEFIERLIEIYSKILKANTSGDNADDRVEKFKNRLLQSLNGETKVFGKVIGRMVDKINQEILTVPEYGYFILRKPLKESQKVVIIPHLFLTQRPK